MRPRTTAALAAAVLMLAACGDDEASPSSSPDSTPTSGPDVDPREYYDEYVEGQYDSASPTAGAPTAGAPTAGAPTEARPSTGDAGAEQLDDGGSIPIEPPPGPTEDNTFDDVGDTGFVPTATDAESTFGLDVDTGSYRVARTFAEEGFRPPRDSIRVEEWINAFDYGYAPPTDQELALSVQSGVAPHTPDGTRLVGVGVQTEELAAADRPPANITFVIDTSGSMDIRERLGLVKSSLALLVTNLRPDDTIAIVAYGSEAGALLEPTPVRDGESIVEAIERLQPGGSTNMEAGLRLGYREAARSFDPDAVNAVVLASDGVANVGVSEPDGLSELIEQRGKEGISLVTVGFGMGNYNDTLMEQLADRGDGFYSYVDTFEEAERLFVDELTPTLTVVARDAKIQVAFDPAVVESYRLVGYENRAVADEDFRNDAVDAGELGAGHTVSALYEVQLADPRLAEGEVGSVALRWESADTGEVAETSAPITIGPHDAENTGALALAATVASGAEVLRGNSVVSGRQVTLDMVIADAEALAADDPQASDLADYLRRVAPFEEAPNH